ncbi:MAG: M23 family metallopeptidase [Lachnospiraceae bacterium]|nr:M23 family metallopeptidase [Lachnospiraceae bacterium]
METSYQISLKQKKHRRKTQHLMIMTTSAVDAEVKPMTFHPVVSWILILTLSVFLGVMVGLFYLQKDRETVYQDMIAEQGNLISAMEEENLSLQSTINSLQGEVQILSDTVNTKVAAEAELTETINSQSVPTEFPLTSSASMEEFDEDHPILIFTASAGTAVVASAAGVVTSIEDDETYGHCVTIDHGNGYITIYRNADDVMVKEGESVSRGNTLFVISDKKHKLVYEMMFEGEYISPMDELSING